MMYNTVIEKYKRINTLDIWLLSFCCVFQQDISDICLDDAFACDA